MIADGTDRELSLITESSIAQPCFGKITSPQVFVTEVYLFALPSDRLVLEPGLTTMSHRCSADAAASPPGLLDSCLSKTALHPGRECTRDPCKAVHNSKPGSNSNTLITGA